MNPCIPHHKIVNGVVSLSYINSCLKVKYPLHIFVSYHMCSGVVTITIKALPLLVCMKNATLWWVSQGGKYTHAVVL